MRKRVEMECLFYNTSPTSAFHWFMSRNVTLPFFLVPYPVKIEASLQNSLRLQCTCLCILDISQCLKCFECQSGYRVSKNAANDVDHTAMSTEKILSHIFLKTTYHRVKHCWTVKEKEHHLNPKEI